MTVATHNPSNLVLKEIEVKVPHANFKVQIFNDSNWYDADTNVICNEQSEIQNY